MPFSRKSLNRFFAFWIQSVSSLFRFVLIFLFWSQITYALDEGQPIHFSGDKQLWNRKANRVELFGHAAVVQVGETLTADYVLLDLNSRILDAKGNCVYVASDSVIWGDEMHFNLDTRTGTVVAGRVSNDRFTLRGERINKLGPGRFQTHWGNYSTCKDCAASWSFESEDMDMQIEGYAYLSNVTTRVKDAPAFWMPYLVVPMKTRRQSGVLFPRFSLSGIYGTTFVLPVYWATSRSTDMTIGLGEYSKKGHRLEWEGRYVYDNFRGIGNFYYTADREFVYNNHRWSFDLVHTQKLPYGIDAKLKLTEMSDNLYPFQFGQDLPGTGGEAFTKSSLMLSTHSPSVSAFVAMQRYRNLLNSTAGDPAAQAVQFDSRTVQPFPYAMVTTNDKLLFDSGIVGGVSLGLTRFTRGAGAFDYDNSSVPFGTAPPAINPPAFSPGVDPIRKATRFSLLPTLYTTWRPLDVIQVVPSLQYRGYFYHFDGLVSPLARGYLLFQTDISAQLEKIYDYSDNKEYPRAKHIIRPILTYSLIPFRNEDESHAFISQIKRGQSQGILGYNFDNNDIVPYSYTKTGALYFVPLGHSLAYGLSSQWIRRKGSDGASLAPVYQNTIELSAGQAINFLEISSPTDPLNRHVLTRFFTALNFNFDHFMSQSTYYYNPDIDNPGGRQSLSTSATFILERSQHQRIFNFDRSISFGYSYNPLTATSYLSSSLYYSLSDYILPYGSISYNFVAQRAAGATVGVQFQSPSHCWKMVTSLGYAAGIPGLNWGFDFQFNLTGGGFGGFAEIANQFVSGVSGAK